jgi:peptidoglycan hydrolase CwlO-like protein
MIGAFVEPEEQPENLEQSKHTKILHRKQIEKRLQGLKPTEYQKIVSNLTSQNDKLKQEVKNINDKVEELMHSKKVSRNKNPQIEQEILRLKKELELKYESMNFLKEAVRKHSQGELSEEMKLKIRERSNIIAKCEK